VGLVLVDDVRHFVEECRWPKQRHDIYICKADTYLRRHKIKKPLWIPCEECVVIKNIILEAKKGKEISHYQKV
jgi:hypothetical protein